MGNFNRGYGDSSGQRGGRRDFRGGGAGRGFGRGPGRGPGRDDDRPMYQVTCAECGNACDVPFRPTGNKPVYCRDCFDKINGDAPRSDRRGPARHSTRHNDEGVGGKSAMHIDQQFAQINDKLDKILRRLTPSYARPSNSADDSKEEAGADATE